MTADVDGRLRFGPGGQQRLVDETDDQIAAVTQSHRGSPFVIRHIGRLSRPLKN
jgi:hypothetical protein